jgi:ribosome-binding ATPase YchF (GTP1/OBG family)
LAALSGSAKVIAATIEVVDIAGPVAGASKGEGLGNKVLAWNSNVKSNAYGR